ncbi:glycosyltransferase [Halorientalis brevis]|uniref:Glycosyltransferase n=1 Tax=Halorientalis brevis TaxID=1126241 RepID=A0ABD6C9Q2_9EURY|nr:glycosyltransferase family 2 protein [Halorientalis brevis]
MEVETAESQQFSIREGVRYLAATLCIMGLLYVPAVFAPSWIRVLTTVLLVALLGLTGRALLSAVLAFAQPATPELDRQAELPDVSVVIPAYNEAAVLPATIDACRNLEYPAEKLEIVLCYEADSVDDTEAICKAAAADDDRFVAVERDEPGGGKAKATNYALQYATGEIIASIDADHRFKPDAIRRAVAWFQQDDDIWCVKGRCYGDNAEDSLLSLHATVERHIAEKGDLFAREVFGGFTIFGGGQAFFRATLFDELGDFDEDVLVEDIDMSSKIHEHGKRLHVDPSIVTFEENPATLQSWWSQRKRWARGWMQVAFRYLTRLPRSENVSTIARLDSAFTFFYALVPVFVAFTIPILGLELFGVNTDTYLPYGEWLWRLLAVTPALAVGCVFVQDYRDGFSHDWREYLAPATLWFYLALQSVVYVVSFMDEVVFGRPSVYVTTARVDSQAGANNSNKSAESPSD